MQIWSNVQSLLAILGGGVFVIGLTGTAAYGLFKIFGEKWLDARFAERLEALKHEQQKQLEVFKVQIARLIDRATKLNQREFDAIPEAWARLYEAFATARSLLVSLQTYPDIDNMTGEQRSEFIGACKLDEWEKKELASVENKTNYYRERIFWHKLGEVQEYARELHMYVMKNSILMPRNIRKQFVLLDKLIWNAITEQEFNHMHEFNPKQYDERENFMKEGETIMTNLEKAIEQRLSTLTEGESL